MDVLNRIRADPGMERLWENYRRKFEYAEGISWDEVMGSVEMLYQMTAEKKVFFVKHFSLKKASKFPFFSRGISLFSAGLLESPQTSL